MVLIHSKSCKDVIPLLISLSTTSLACTSITIKAITVLLTGGVRPFLTNSTISESSLDCLVFLSANVLSFIAVAVSLVQFTALKRKVLKLKSYKELNTSTHLKLVAFLITS